MPRGIHMKAKWQDPEYRAKQQPKVVKSVTFAAASRIKPKIPITCKICGNVFMVNESAFLKRNPCTCSKECLKQYQIHFSKKAENHPQWRGGLRKHSSGYVLQRCPGHPYADTHGYVLQHRLVAEKVLGRYLFPTEQVHHKNKVKTDNRPENLEVLTAKEHGLKHSSNGHWSIHGDACSECGKSNKRHAGQGLCINCWTRKDRWSKRATLKAKLSV